MTTSQNLTDASGTETAVPSIRISLGKRASDAHPVLTQCTWPEFTTWLKQRQREVGPKDGEYVCLAEFRPHPPAHQHGNKSPPCHDTGACRDLDFLVHSSGVPLDFDKGNVSEATIRAVLNGYSYVAYTTYGHTPAAPRWRVFVPVASPMDAATHKATWMTLNAAFSGLADPAASDASRLSYLPGACIDPTAAQIFHADGALLVPTIPVAEPTPVVKERSDGPVPGWAGPADDDQLYQDAQAVVIRGGLERIEYQGKSLLRVLCEPDVAILEKRYPPRESHQQWNYSEADSALISEWMFFTGNDQARSVQMALRAGCVTCRGEPEDEMRRKLGYLPPKRIRPKVYQWPKPKVPKGTKATIEDPTQTEQDPRPVILLKSGAFDKYTAQVEKLLADSVYVHGHGLVRIGRAAEILDESAATKREAAQAVCIPVSSGWLRRESMERAKFWKFDKRAQEWEPKDCPKELADNILDLQAWPSFRQLIAISPLPVLRTDMSVWTHAGYDTVTGVYHQPTLTMPAIPSQPTRDDAMTALSRLLEPFDQFPYASREAVAVFLSHVISAVLRPTFDTSPIFLYTSPIAATGKTLLADMPNTIAHGVMAAHSPYSESDELRKVLFASLLAGDAALTLDNVPNGQKIRAPGLCVFATSGTYSDRILGVSETRKVPNRCTVVLTGNNITPVSDLARRSLVCRLDANAESARGRKFRISDLRGHVRGQRAQLIVDVHTIVRAYACAGRPDVAHPLESFEGWSRLVRDPLVWLGQADPVASQETETDDELGPLQGAFEAIAAATLGQGHAFTAAQLAGMTALQPPAGLRDVLINAGCSEPADGKKLGYWLREQKDRVACGMKLVTQRGTHNSVAQWRLRQV